MSNIITMGRKKGPDLVKLERIKAILSRNPSGIWVRELARKTRLDKSTVSIYLSKYLENEIEDLFITGNRWIRVVRLKK